MKVRDAIRTVAAALLSFPILSVSAADKSPQFDVHTFDVEPAQLKYFDDTDIILLQDYDLNAWRSKDGGKSWVLIHDVPKGKAVSIVFHEWDNDRAYVITDGGTHFKTDDRGETWQSFFTEVSPDFRRSNILSFHAGDKDRIIFNGLACESIFCEEAAMYTVDGFKSDAKFLRDGTEGCWWAKSSVLFTTGREDLDKQRILCTVKDEYSPFMVNNRLVISDNYFEAVKSGGVVQEFEPNIDTDRAARGIVNLASVKKYLMVATASQHTDEMALFVTDDTIKWHRAMFPTDHVITQEAYTVLESTNYSIQIDVATGRRSKPMGVMFTSNSNGTFFTRNAEHTNRNVFGNVDFEKIAGIQGIFMVNTVKNYQEVEKDANVDKHVITEITHDDGRTFSPITSGGDRIHLHSVTELLNVGRVFSSPAPGLVMGNGNSGERLRNYDEARLWISDDAGVTWLGGPEGPHKYEFGDQGSVLLAVHDSQKTEIGEIKYSLNHGKDWQVAKFPDGLLIKPWILTTTPDSTSLKFLLVGRSGAEGKAKFPVIAIDFAGLQERTCGKDDMETWDARVDKDGKSMCLMGHTQSFQRRKKDADCFLMEEFARIEVITNNCECTDADFECDYNFRKNDKGECVAAGPIVAPEEACQNAGPEATFKGSSGYRLIPGDTCERRKGVAQKDDLVERKCSDSNAGSSGPGSGNVTSTQKIFGDYEYMEKHYLLRGDSSSSSDETIIVRGKDADKLLITHDHGTTWAEIKDVRSKDVAYIMPHAYVKDMVFFIGASGKVTYTTNRGGVYYDFRAPSKLNFKEQIIPMYFHPDKKDYIIWIGEVCKGDHCFNEASLSTDRGDTWKTIKREVRRCEFTGSNSYRFRDENQIICLAHEAEDPNKPLQLMGSVDKFETETIFETEVKDFAIMAEFIVTAVQNTTGATLQAMASLDGKTFAQAHFPYGFKVDHQRAFTVLDSSTHAINLFVAEETEKDKRYGSILKSNSNGTSYVMSISGVNCDDKFYVDFEKMLGLEGVVLVNTVANRDEKSAPKKLQTRISHNDGSQWAYITPPQTDVDGKSFSCSSSSGTEKCALHIQGYTQRENKRNTYSSVGAVGLMFGWGNVGEFLGDPKDTDTYMTTDAGLTWKQVKKGRWTWQFGDQGSILVLVKRHEKTRHVSYTTDEGRTWQDHTFADADVEVEDITTMSSGTSRKFIVWGKTDGKRATSQVAYTIDFTGLADRECKYDDDQSVSDYDLWSPTHPLTQNNCLFGHKTEYLRKKIDTKCYNGYRIQHLYGVDNCTCTRSDYECDFNYELDTHNACALVSGFQPLSREAWCAANPSAIEYFNPTGYRRIPLTTCTAGQAFDQSIDSQPCPGKEPQYDARHDGISGFALFLVILLPFVLAGGAGWWVWKNGMLVGTPFGGSIRLGEESTGSFGQGAFESDSPLVRVPIVVVSAIAAVVGALPLVAGAVWRSAVGLVGRFTGGGGGGSRGAWSRVSNGNGGLNGSGGNRSFTTRDSFARGRGDYAVADEDEGELLGEESDEEV